MGGLLLWRLFNDFWEKAIEARLRPTTSELDHHFGRINSVVTVNS